MNLHESYLFTKIGAAASEYQKNHPEKRLIKLSIGDVTLPLAPAVVSAMKEAAEELARRETFKGYAPDQSCYGYDFLVHAIRLHYARIFCAAGCGEEPEADEIFISDGAKSDLGNLLDLFSADNTVLLPDPVYPAYLDANVMDGRKIEFLRAGLENEFLPMPERGKRADLIYLCSPGNPTGGAYPRQMLKTWVDYASDQGAVILYDAAYEAFVTDGALCRSIYEVEGAKECAVEICSFSKTAGFTGVRCGYTVIPKTLKREGVSLNALWRRRLSAKFNGVSYLTQRGAAAAFSEEGERQTAESRAYYRENAKIIMESLKKLGFWFTGGKNSPYIWMKCPESRDSMRSFYEILERANVVVTPGVGFGKCGEGYLRLSSFSTREDTQEACARIEKLYGH